MVLELALEFCWFLNSGLRLVLGLTLDLNLVVGLVVIVGIT